ncbi:MAG: archaeal proteasome endopeptidase complex subunit alpha [Euryarchaeota archaeon]|nr:archaeal proteasome endopeptidase complex subunit alpha [Euryarchaeota archaeon]
MQPNMAYDRAITVFSPDGRLFQVEYAREAVKRGTTTVGVKFDDGVLLIVDKRISSHLVEPVSIEKIFKLDHHVGCATSGLVADARALVDRARVDAQMNRITYDEPISLHTLVKKICDFKQSYTQYGGVRPFGTALLIAGVDDTGAHLFETDPSGALMEYKASSVGSGRNQAMEIFEDAYKDGLDQKAAIVLALKALHAATEGKLNPEAIEIGIVTTRKPFYKLDEKEIKKLVETAKEAGDKGKKSEG